MTDLEKRIMSQVDQKIKQKIEESFDQKIQEMEQKLTTKIEKQLEETEEKDKRKNNIVIWNIPESDKQEQKEKKQDDQETILKTLNMTTDIDIEDISDLTRIGKLGLGNKPRLVKVTLKTNEIKERIIKSQKKININKTDRSKFVYINHDQTPADREFDRKQREELKKRIAEGEENICIRNKQIVSLKPRPGSGAGGGTQ